MVSPFNNNQESLESIGLDRIQTFDRPESTYGESWRIFREKFKRNDSPNSREYTLTKVLQPILDDVFEKTGKRFQNFGNAPQYPVVGKANPGNLAYDVVTPTFDEELAKLNKHIKKSGLDYGIITQEDLLGKAGELARESRSDADEILKAGGPFGSQALPTAVSYFGDMVSDPYYWPFLFYGNITGNLAKEAMAKVFVQQFAAGAGYELVTRPKVATFKKSIGEEYTLNDMAKDVGIGGLSAGVGGVTLNVLFAGIKKALPSIKIPENPTNQEAHDIIKQAARLLDPNNPNGHKIPKQLIDELNPEKNMDMVNYTFGSLKDDDVIINANPFKGADGETEHIKLVNESLRNLGEYPDAAPINKPTSPLNTEKFQTKESVVEATLPEDQIKFNIDELEVDAKTFQFKSGTDEFGVSGKMKNVTKWEPFLADKILVFENKAGKKIVVDGHQRLGLAKRIIAQNDGQKPALYGHLFREVDGFTAQEVRTIGAAKNIANIQKLNAMDIAKVLKLDKKKLDSIGIPRTSEFYKQGNDLSKLGDDAWLMMENKVIDENFGALVGRMVDDVDKQPTIIKLLNETKPTNLVQAESIINQALRAGFKTESQETLFGNLKVTETLFKERAVILDETLKRLKRDKQVFKTLVENQSQIESKGNQLVKNINKEMEVNNAQAEEILKRLAHTTGTIGDELTKAAKKFKETKSKRAAVDDLSRVIRQEIQRGNISRSTDGRVGDAIKDQKTEIMDPIPERTNIQGFDEPRKGNVVQEQADQLENVLKEEIGIDTQSPTNLSASKTDPTVKEGAGFQDSDFLSKNTGAAPPSSVFAKDIGKPISRTPTESRGSMGDMNFSDIITYHKVSNLDELFKLANKNKTNANNTLTNIARKYKDGKAEISIKEKQKLLDNIAQKKELDSTHSFLNEPDIFRGRIIVNNIDDIQKVVNDIKKDFGIVREKNLLKSPTDTGYRGYHLQLITKDGLGFELQIHHQKLLDKLTQLKKTPTSVYKFDKNLRAKFTNKIKITKEEVDLLDQYKLNEKKINDELYNEVIQEEKMVDELLTDIEARKPILDESIEFQEPNLQSADGVISKNQTVREVFEEFNKDKEMLNRLKDCA